MKEYTKLQLIELIGKGLVKDNSYWIIDDGLYQWKKGNQNFYQTGISYLHTISDFSFDGLLDIVYELEDLIGKKGI